MNQHRYTSRGGYYWTCPLCGANLDPDERCPCEDEKMPAPVSVYQSAKGINMPVEVPKTHLRGSIKKQKR